jgi:hypothetical protein
MTECVQIAGWIASSVSTPVIIDGDTGHGGNMAVRRLVRDCQRHHFQSSTLRPPLALDRLIVDANSGYTRVDTS